MQQISTPIRLFGWKRTKHPQYEHSAYHSFQMRTTFPTMGIESMHSLPHATEETRCSMAFLESRLALAAAPVSDPTVLSIRRL